MKTPKEAYFEAKLYKINIKENEQIILKSKSAFWSYLFALDIPGANLEVLENIVIENKELPFCYEWSYLFAKNIPNANIKKHIEKIKTNSNFKKQVIELEEKLKILQEQKLLKAYMEALSGINIKENERIVLEANNAILSFLFSKNIKGADINKHKEIFIKSDIII